METKELKLEVIKEFVNNCIRIRVRLKDESGKVISTAYEDITKHDLMKIMGS